MTTYDFTTGTGSRTFAAGEIGASDAINFVDAEDLPVLNKKGNNLEIVYSEQEGDVITITDFFTTAQAERFDTFILWNSDWSILNDNAFSINVSVANGATYNATAYKENITLTAGETPTTVVLSANGQTDTITGLTINDIVKFTGKTVSDLAFAKNGNDMEITYGNGDKVTLDGYYTTSRVENLVTVSPGETPVTTSYKISNVVDDTSFIADGYNRIWLIEGNATITNSCQVGVDDVIKICADNVTYTQLGADLVVNYTIGETPKTVTLVGYLNAETGLPAVAQGSNVKLMLDGATAKELLVKQFATSAQTTNIDANSTEAQEVIASNYGDTVNVAGNQDNTVKGGTSGDTINMGTATGNNTVDAGAGNNTITTGAGTDTVVAGDGGNTVNMGAGADNINLGDGDNTVQMAGATTGAADKTVNLGAGQNTVTADVAANKTATIAIEGAAGKTQTVNVTGGTENAITVQNGAANVTLNGGTDANVQTAEGNDNINLLNGATTATVNAGAGEDTITVAKGVSATVTGGEGSDHFVLLKDAMTRSPITPTALITDATSADTIDFEDAAWSDLKFSRTGATSNDLKIEYGNNIATVQDFFSMSHPVNIIRTNDDLDDGTTPLVEHNIKNEAVITVTLQDGDNYEATAYKEIIKVADGASATVEGLNRTKDAIELYGGTLSRVNNGGLVIAYTTTGESPVTTQLTVTDFFDMAMGLKINDVATSANTEIAVSLTGNTAYEVSNYKETITVAAGANATVEGLTAADKLVVDGTPTLTRTWNGTDDDKLVIATTGEGARRITVTDFFNGNSCDTLNTHSIKTNETIDVVLATDTVYASESAYRENISGEGSVSGMTANDSIVTATTLEAGATFARTNAGAALTVTGTDDKAITVTDFFTNGIDFNVNGASTTAMSLAVTLDGTVDYVGTKYNELITATAAANVSGLSANDRIASGALVRTYDGTHNNALQVGDLTVTDFFTTNACTRFIGDELITSETLTVNLSNNAVYAAEASFAEVITGSGTVSGMSASDSIKFANATSYTQNANGMFVTDGATTITISDYALNNNLTVLEGTTAVDLTDKTLTVTGLNTFTASAVFGHVEITGTSSADSFTGGAGDDVISGGAGNDNIIGGAGADTITGGAGNDILTGGEGNDTFVFNAGDGQDHIIDGAYGDAIYINEEGAELSYAWVDNQLAISYGTNGGKITIDNFNLSADPGTNIDDIYIKKNDGSGTYNHISISDNMVLNVTLAGNTLDKVADGYGNYRLIISGYGTAKNLGATDVINITSANARLDRVYDGTNNAKLSIKDNSLGENNTIVISDYFTDETPCANLADGLITAKTLYVDARVDYSATNLFTEEITPAYGIEVSGMGTADKLLIDNVTALNRTNNSATLEIVGDKTVQVTDFAFNGSHNFILNNTSTAGATINVALSGETVYAYSDSYTEIIHGVGSVAAASLITADSDYLNINNGGAYTISRTNNDTFIKISGGDDEITVTDFDFTGANKIYVNSQETPVPTSTVIQVSLTNALGGGTYAGTAFAENISLVGITSAKVSGLTAADNINLGANYTLARTYDGTVATNATLIVSDGTNTINVTEYDFSATPEFTINTAASITTLNVTASTAYTCSNAFTETVLVDGDITISNMAEADKFLFANSTKYSQIAEGTFTIEGAEGKVLTFTGITPATVPAAYVGTFAENTQDTLSGSTGKTLYVSGIANYDGSGVTAFKNLDITGTDADEIITGGAGDDVINASGGVNTLYGGAGADAIHAGASGDIIYGGEGNDTLYGGAGADKFHFSDDFGADVVSGAGATDALYFDGIAQSAISYAGNVISIANTENTVTLSDSTVNAYYANNIAGVQQLYYLDGTKTAFDVPAALASDVTITSALYSGINFAAGFNTANLTFTRTADGLVIGGVNGHTITISDFNFDAPANNMDALTVNGAADSLISAKTIAYQISGNYNKPAENTYHEAITVANGTTANVSGLDSNDSLTVAGASFSRIWNGEDNNKLAIAGSNNVNVTVTDYFPTKAAVVLGASPALDVTLASDTLYEQDGTFTESIHGFGIVNAADFTTADSDKLVTTDGAAVSYKRINDGGLIVVAKTGDTVNDRITVQGYDFTGATPIYINDTTTAGISVETTINASGDYSMTTGITESYIIEAGSTGVTITDNNASQAVKDKSSNDLYVVKDLTNTIITIDDYATVGGTAQNTPADLLYIINAGDGIKVDYFNISTSSVAGPIDITFRSTSAGATGSITIKNYLTGSYSLSTGVMDRILVGNLKLNFQQYNLRDNVRDLIKKANTEQGTSYTCSDDLIGTEYEEELMNIFNGTAGSRVVYRMSELGNETNYGPYLFELYPVEDLTFMQVAAGECAVTNGEITQTFSYSATSPKFIFNSTTYDYVKFDYAAIPESSKGAIYTFDGSANQTIAGADYNAVNFSNVSNLNNLVYNRKGDNVEISINNKTLTITDFFANANNVVVNFRQDGTANSIKGQATINVDMNDIAGDTYNGTDYKEVITGTDADETIIAGNSEDKINAGAGNDTIYAGTLTESDGILDTITFSGDFGNDTLYTAGLEDSLVFDGINRNMISFNSETGVITVGENNSVTIADYDAATSVASYKALNDAGVQQTFNLTNTDRVLFDLPKPLTASVVITNSSYYNGINFPNIAGLANLKYEYTPENGLIISAEAGSEAASYFGDKTITIADFALTGSAASNIDIIANKGALSANIVGQTVIYNMADGDSYDGTDVDNYNMNLKPAAAATVTVSDIKTADNVELASGTLRREWSAANKDTLTISDGTSFVNVTDYYAQTGASAQDFTLNGSALPAELAVTLANTALFTDVYEASATIAETFTGNGTVSGLTANDNIALTSAEFHRTGTADTLIVNGNDNQVISVSDYNFTTENTTVKVGGDLVAYTDTIYVDLNSEACTGTAYIEVFSGSGSVSNIGEGDSLAFATETTYTRSGANLVVSATGQSITVTDYVAGSEPTVVVGELQDNIANKTLYVENLAAFDASAASFKFHDVNITGTDGADAYTGSTNADIITGGEGNDTLTGNGGNDTFIFNAGDGADVITDANAGDIIKFAGRTSFEGMTFTQGTGTNIDKLIISCGNGDFVTINGYFTAENVVAANHINTFMLGETPYTLEWHESNGLDHAGMYLVQTGEGDTTAIEGIPNWINSGEGEDSIIGSNKYDMLAGNQGDDEIISTDGYTEIYGAEGADIIIAEGGNNFVVGGSGADDITVAGGNNVICFANTPGESGDVKAFGVDTLEGATDTDTLKFSLGGETPTGYAFTELRFERSWDAEHGVAGNDLIISDGIPSDTEGVYQNQVTIEGFFTAAHPVDKVVALDENGDQHEYSILADAPIYVKVMDDYTGSKYNEILDASGATHGVYVRGGLGNDELIGSAHDDILRGSEGTNVVNGGAGDDTIFVGDGADTVVFEGNFGNDVIRDASSNDALTFADKALEDLTFTKNGTTLKIDDGSNNTVTLNNFFNANGSIAEGALDTVWTLEMVEEEPTLVQHSIVTDKEITVILNNEEYVAQTTYMQCIQGVGTVTGMAAALDKARIEVAGTPVYTRTDNGTDLVISDKITITNFDYGFTDGETPAPNEVIRVNNGTTANMTLNVTLTGALDENAYAATGYAEVISGVGAIDGFNAETDSVIVEGTPTYSRINKGGLTINGLLTVNNFFEEGEDITVNGGTTEGMTLNVTLTDALETPYAATSYTEVFSGEGTITGAAANDNVLSTGAVFSRMSSDNNLIITDSDENVITLNDFFGVTSANAAKVNGVAVINSTINVELDGDFIGTEYTESISGAGTVHGLSANDSIVMAGAELSRTFDGSNNAANNQLTLTANNKSIVVTDFFTNNACDTLNGQSILATQEIKVALNNTAANASVYTATDYAETFYGSGKVSGLQANDNIAMGETHADVEFSRLGTSNVLYVKGNGNNVIQVTDFNFATANTTVVVSDALVTYDDTINVDLNNEACIATAYKEVFSKSGSVTGLGANDVLMLTGETSYALSTNGLTVAGNPETEGHNTIVVPDYTAGKEPTVMVGNVQDNLGNKTLSVSGLTTFDATTTTFKNVAITGTENNDTYTGSTGADNINGAAGNDTITGGKGNDTLAGGEGYDTFIFNEGDGIDTITDAELGDTIKFANKVWDDLTFTRGTGDNVNDLLIAVDDDKVIISGFFNGNNVDTVVTTDGTHSISEVVVFDVVLSDDQVWNKAVAGYAGYKVNISLANNADNASVSGLEEGDNIVLAEGELSRNWSVADANKLTISDGTNSIVVSDYFEAATYPAFTLNTEALPNALAVTLANTATFTDIYAADGRFNESISGTGKVSGLTTNDKIVTAGEPTYSRTNDGNLFVDAIEVTDFVWDGAHDIYVNEGTTEGMTVDVTLTGGYTYTATGYAEDISGTGKVSGLDADDRIVTADEPTYTRTNGGNLFVDAIEVTDFDFGFHEVDEELVPNMVINVNNGTTEGMTVGVTLTEGAEYIATGYKENITLADGTNSATVSGLSSDDNIELADVTLSRTNNGKLIVGGKITVDDFAFDKSNDFLVNGDSTADKAIYVNLTDDCEYTATTYKEVISGNGSVTGVSADDIILIQDYSDDAVLVGNDMTFTYGNNNQITVNNFFNAAGELTFAGRCCIQDGEGAFVDVVYDELDVAVSGRTYFSNTFSYIDEESGEPVEYSLFNSVNITGTNGVDTYIGGEGADTFNAGKGADTLTGRGGADTFVFNAGDGADVITDATSVDVIKFNRDSFEGMTFAQDGTNLIVTYGEGDTVTINGYFTAENVVAEDAVTTFNVNNTDYTLAWKQSTVTDEWDMYNVIDGRGAATGVYNYAGELDETGLSFEMIHAVRGIKNWINGGDGEQFIFGENEGDMLAGNNDDDVISAIGVDGDVEIYGGAGNDNLFGGAGNDWIAGNEGNDRISGGAGDDYLFGGDWTNNADPDGEDFITGGAGNDHIYGRGGDDQLFGESGNDVIYGGAGEDVIYGGKGDDVIYGGADNDIIDGGIGNDTLNGGTGNDTFVFNSGDGDDVINDINGGDTIRFTDKVYNELTFTKAEDSNNITISHAAGDAYTLTATLSAGTFDGIEYTEGTYTFELKEITAGVLAGKTAWICVAGPEDQAISREPRQDEIDKGIPAEAKISMILDNTDIVGPTSQAGSVTISGIRVYNGISDITEEYKAAVGGAEATLDSYSEHNELLLNSQSSVTINDYADVVHSGTSVTLETAGSQNADLKDARFNVTMTGESPYMGSWLNENIVGTQGDDIIIANAGNDIVYAGAGNDIVSAGRGDDFVFGGEGNDFIDGGYGDDIILGDSGDDLLSGDAGNDQIFGGAGNDEINGGSGDDTLYGGADSDTFLFKSGSGDDTIKDIEAGDAIKFTDKAYADLKFTKAENGNDVIISSSAGDVYTLTATLSAGTFDGIEYTEGTYTFELKEITAGVLAGKTAWICVAGPEGQAISREPRQDEIDKGIPAEAKISMILDNTDIAGPTSQAGTVTISDIQVFNNMTNITDTYKAAASASIDAYSAYNESLLVDTVLIENYASGAEKSVVLTTTDAQQSNLKDVLFNVNMTNNEYNGAWINENIVGTDANDTIDGGAGNDIIYGGAGNDNITGGEGNDTIYTGVGNNTIIIDTTTEFGNDTIITTEESVNTIRLSGLTKEEFINATRVIDKTTGDMTITLANNKSFKIAGYSNIDASSITFQLDDGVTGLYTRDAYGRVYGTENVDIIDGDVSKGNKTLNTTFYGQSGNDTIIAGKGNDTLYGGNGADTFIFRVGDGKDAVINEGAACGNDTLKFYISDGDKFTVRASGTDLIINYGTSDVTTVKNCLTNSHSVKFIEVYKDNVLQVYGPDGNLTDAGVLGAHTITIPDDPTAAETAPFITLSATAFGANAITGTTYSEAIYGNANNNTLKGGGGNDVIYGMAGTNTIYAGTRATDSATVYSGTGKDTIYAGKGEDTYVFNLDAGIGDDILYNVKSNDHIKFVTDNYVAANVHFLKEGNNLKISYGAGENAQSVTLVNYYSTAIGNAIDEVDFVNSANVVQEQFILSEHQFGSINNDRFNINGAINTNVTDPGGNDVYSITGNNADGIINIKDDGAGNDAFGVSGNNQDITVNITDDGGVNNYAFVSSGTTAAPTVTHININNSDNAKTRVVTAGDGNDTYKFSGNFRNDTVNIVDQGGKNTYTVSGSGNANLSTVSNFNIYNIGNGVNDNDAYGFSGSCRNDNVNVVDEGGTNTYAFSGSGVSQPTIVNVSRSVININTDPLATATAGNGNDRYAISGNFRQDDVTIVDNGGTNVYGFSGNGNAYTLDDPNIVSEYNIRSTANDGKDTYGFSGNYRRDEINIVDEGGANTYTFSGVGTATSANAVYLTESVVNINAPGSTATATAGSGDDKYTFSGGFRKDNVTIVDNGGTNTYAVSGSGNVHALNDANYQSNFDITSGNGTDTYNFSGGYRNDVIQINDAGGANKFNYNVSGIASAHSKANINIISGADDDTYTFSGNYRDDTIVINDNGGDDKYTINGTYRSGSIDITDAAGDDTYSIASILNGGKTVIDDQGGADTLIVSGLNKNTMAMMLDWKKDGTLNGDNLFISGKNCKGGVIVEDYSAVGGDNVIETIKAGSVVMDVDAATDALREQVVGWLSSEDNHFDGCNSVSDVFNNDAALTAMMTDIYKNDYTGNMV